MSGSQDFASRRQQELLVGFDARKTWLPGWDEERRRLYSLDSSIGNPCSVDPLVWPSALDVEYLGADQAPRADWSSEDECIHARQAWWDNYPLFATVNALSSLISRSGKPSNYPVVIVGISIVYFEDFTPLLDWPKGRLERAIESEWEFLGYDIADAGLISALSNCGYVEKQRDEAERRWGGRLTGRHLFRDATHALEFCAWSELRVPEHAPFAVFGLYSVRTM